MQITRQELNPCTIELAVVCDPNEVVQGFDKAIKDFSKKTKLPGFRPGHAPKSMIEGMLSPEELNESAAEHIVKEAYKAAIQKEDLTPEPTLRPLVELKEIKRDPASCIFNVKVNLPPKVELGDYKGLKVEAPDAAVTDEEVNYQLDELRKRYSTQVPVTDRGVQEGDVVVVNLKETGSKDDGKNFMSVVGQTFAEMDAILIGAQAEDIRVATLKFPKTFQDKAFAGKEVEVQITVNSVSTLSIPELDEAFAQGMKVENVDDLKEKVRELLVEAKSEAVSELTTDRLLDALLEKSTVHVPDGMWETLAERRLVETAREQREAGKSIEDYAKENGMTLDGLVAAWKDKAKMHVVRALLIREIFTKEEMKLDTEDLNRELLSMAREYGAQPAEVLELLRRNNSLEELHFRAISRRVSQFLIDNAVKA